MKGALLVNHYLKGDKFDDLNKWMQKSADKYNIELKIITNKDTMIGLCDDNIKEYDFVIFWDKDILLARYLENMGIKLYNCASSIEMCDDKAKTYIELLKHDINMPHTIVAPLTFYELDEIPDYLENIACKLGFPLVVKERYGSFGMNVYLVHNMDELEDLFMEKQSKLLLFQKYIANSYGRDIRLQVVGDKVVAAMYRYSYTDFRANITNGASMKNYEPSKKQCEMAIKACKALKLDFAGVDILFDENDEPVLCEVNSNAHFINIHSCTGVNVADCIIEYITNNIKSN